MESDIVVGFIIGLIIGIIIIYAIMRSKIENKFIKFKAKYDLEVQDRIKEAREESNNMQRASLKGKITEQIAPILPEFAEKYEIADARFIGSPIDFVIFKNMSKFDKKSDVNEPIEIEFVEVKTGKNKGLTPIEEAVEEACKKKGISFEILKPKIE